ncbi:synaptic vesicle glycoprotein 2C-like isoform X3 [Vespula squamosa]|uniref:Synaptic vesicle glycoprotein 2C-like isoform X3 n=1 Tax=Vespula squamosa TaxID=30214 RepID=A0ABD2B9L6_VESSQ
MLCITILYTMVSYYTLMLWFPELFQRFAKYEIMYPEESASYPRHDNVFFHTLLSGLACVPLSIILPLTVKYTEYKIYLIICTFLCTIVTISFFFIRSSTQNLILSCIFEALTSICMSIIFCMIVDLFPTNLRMMAAALATFCARLGSFAGNIWLLNGQLLSTIDTDSSGTTLLYV